MSFGFAVGDVLAVLGLFERVAIELRNYKNAPAHFQQLGVELELFHTTLKHVLCLSPEDAAEAKTLEQIRAIVMHCLPPIQALINKMRSKQSALGHYRSTRSLSNIGTRLHWSMIAQKDVEDLRTTILSEMVAINMLLSAQQLNLIRNLSLKSQDSKSAQTAPAVVEHSSALVEKTSKILDILSTTPSTISELRSIATIQAEEQSKQLEVLDQSVVAVTAHLDMLSLSVTNGSALLRRQVSFMRRASDTMLRMLQNMKELLTLLAACSKEMLNAISRNTRAMLDVANQMRRIARAIEAIPLHLTLDIIRLDDALGESWALPLQACTTWESFRDLLLGVVYANGRQGTDRIKSNQFVINLAKTGQVIQRENWTDAVKSGLHIEQAMIMSRKARSNTTTPDRSNRAREKENCPYPDCTGFISEQPDRKIMKRCSTCERWSQFSKRRPKLLHLSQSGPRYPAFLPPLEVAQEMNVFRRIQVNESGEAVRDLEDAHRRLAVNDSDPEANAYIGLRLAQDALKDSLNSNTLKRSRKYIEMAIASDNSVAEYWYLLGRVYLLLREYYPAYDAFRQAVYREGRHSNYWITIGTLYYMVNQYRDSVDALRRAILLDPCLYEAWYNLGVLYEACNRQYVDAREAYQRCLELNPNLPEVQARYQVLLNHPDDSQDEMPGNAINTMIDTAIRAITDEVPEIMGAGITINLTRGSSQSQHGPDIDRGPDNIQDSSSPNWGREGDDGVRNGTLRGYSNYGP
ncbi:hypothetical protein F5Y03DRAFT_250448 [Xylaria venustula]|nr:hypothetical protein F5Y03DRAFT_250448 [Xylaria venustula]